MKDHATGPETLLLLDRDDTLVSFDDQRLIEFTRAAQYRDTLHYEHRNAKAEMLVGLPVATAWCWAKGSRWRQQIPQR